MFRTVCSPPSTTEHPGGSKIILKYAGKDATEAYEPIHPPDAITTNLPKEKHLGEVDPATIVKVVKKMTDEDRRREAAMAARPGLDEILNLHDFEAVARKVLSPKAWAYYSSAADDESGNTVLHMAAANGHTGEWTSFLVLRTL